MADINQLKNEIYDLIAQKEQAVNAIERKRIEIAQELCPLQIGDDATIDYKDSIVKIKIDRIYYYMDLVDQMFDAPGKEISWQVAGFRYNKSGLLAKKSRYCANILCYDFDSATNHFSLKPAWQIPVGSGNSLC